MDRGACPHKLGSTNHLRLLLYILVPTVSLLGGLLLLVLALTGMFGTSLLDFSPASSTEPVAESSHGFHSNSTDPPSSSSSSLEVENITSFLQNRLGEVAYHSQSTLATTAAPPASSQAPPTQSHTKLPDWLATVTSLSTIAPISSTTSAPDTGSCQLMVEPQCHMLPYNHTWLSSSAAVVKSSEVDMLLRFFSYLSRLSCYRHILLFGCSLALPECMEAAGGR
ncbi:atrial natriuretic peptide-converting enzyme [Kryptolebias marmoratus]|uniref:atrial natriuretic peptide-converting enzyme n=1 Tax=Kryptolebias marmoratus TaxID=37003 RepID=UPI000D530EB7|nr:atrial natriuretic peptide-converting enzyme [Kryptolebias marmoratus]